MVGTLSYAKSIGLRVSKSSDVAQSDFRLVGAETGVTPRFGEQMLLSQTNSQTALEVSGSKISQRSEFIETSASEDENVEGNTIWYSFSIYIDPVTELPTLIAEGPEANISLFQFNQRDESGSSTSPAMQIELDAYGNIVAEFGTAVGKRSYVLVEGGTDGTDSLGQWVDVVIGVEWATHDSGWMEFHVREQGETEYTLEALDTGQNTSTGQVYLKLGVYRSFLERDPDLQESVTLAYYDGLRRADTLAEAMLSPDEGPLAGTDFADTLLGGAQGELLFANAGDDLIVGGGGADWIDGGLGTDTVSYQDSETFVVLALDGSLPSEGEAAGDTLISIESATGSEFDDILFGDANANTLDGAGGDDDLSGQDGDDVLLGREGADMLLGGNGTDWLDGGTGDDFIFGAAGDDMLIGGAGSDTLSGGEGADTMVDGAGDDVLTGGSGHDFFVFTDEMAPSTEVITDYTRGKGERDRIDLSELELLSGFKNKKAWAKQNVSYDEGEAAVVVDLGDGRSLWFEDHAGLGNSFEHDVSSGFIL